MRRATKIAVSLALAGAVAVACAAPGFDPQAKLSSVRVLAVQADKPFANPGDTVNLTALAVDARPDKTNPMHVYWLPFNCNNPPQDLYYACFAAFAGLTGGGGADGGAGDGGKGLPPLTQPLDITGFLQESPTYQLKLPQNIISSHPPVQGAPDPYGLSITFFIACTGHVFIIPPSPSTGPSGQFVPVACGESPDNLYGADDYVFAFTRVYSYAPLQNADGTTTPVTNANPVIGDPTSTPPCPSGVLFDGQCVDPNQGVVVSRCGSGGPCDHPLDVRVPDDSWEVNPTDIGPDGMTPRHEQIYAEYFYTIGSVNSGGRILFDPIAGRVPQKPPSFTATSDQENGMLYIVVHDNRDGVASVSFPVYVN